MQQGKVRARRPKEEFHMVRLTPWGLKWHTMLGGHDLQRV